MHEASIAISLIETVSDLCQQKGYNSIESVRLKVGKAAGIHPGGYNCQAGGTDH